MPGFNHAIHGRLTFLEGTAPNEGVFRCARQNLGQCAHFLNRRFRLGEDSVKKSPAWPKTPRGLSGEWRRDNRATSREERPIVQVCC
jgi:hypothetical protein